MDTLPPHADNGNPSPIPAASGIYKITCTVNGKIYIGSATNLRKRRDEHFRTLRLGTHRNRYLQRAFNKYGEAAFTFCVIELVLPISLTAREQYWLNKLKPFDSKGYNIARDASAPLLGKKHTPQTRAKIGLSHLRNTYHLGWRASPESREKMRQSHLGKTTHMRGKTPSPEVREKLRQANLGKKQLPEVVERRRQSNLGKKRTSEQIERSRQANLASNRRRREANENHPNLGSKRTPEQVKRFRQAQQKMRAERPSTSSTGLRGIIVYEEKRVDRKKCFKYQFTCQCKGCRVKKTFPYTEEGLAAAKAFAEAHYAAM